MDPVTEATLLGFASLMTALAALASWPSAKTAQRNTKKPPTGYANAESKSKNCRQTYTHTG